MSAQCNRFIVGVDLGREVNHSAIAVAAIAGRTISFIHIERIPLKTGYLQVLAKLRRLVRKLGAHNNARIEIVCDAAGPGQVATELLERRHRAVTITPVAITAGQLPGKTGSGIPSVPRATLLENLHRMLDRNLIHLTAASPHKETWIDELSTVRADGGQKSQDDLAIAVALAAWQSGRKENYCV